MAYGICLNDARAASWSSRPCSEARAPSLVFIPNASTQGPPTSSAVQVNLENSVAITDGFQSTELEARLHLALATFQHGSPLAVQLDFFSAGSSFLHLTFVPAPNWFAGPNIPHITAGTWLRTRSGQSRGSQAARYHDQHTWYVGAAARND